MFTIDDGYLFLPFILLIIYIAIFFDSTQIPHAVGAAYSLKMEGREACTITYFGDGGTSTVNIFSCFISM